MVTIDGKERPKRDEDFTKQEKEALLTELAGSGIDYVTFADQKGISRWTMRNWVRFQSVTPEEKKKWQHRGPYSPEERKKTIEALMKSGLTQEEFARTWGVGLSTLSQWRGLYERGGFAALESYRPSKAGDRRRGSKVPMVVRQEIVAVKRREPYFGLRKIRDWLLRFRGVRVSTGTIRKTVHAEGLIQTQPARRRRRSPDRIRRFERAKSMQLWQSDITQFNLSRHSTRVYLTVFMDDYSRYIVAWRLHTRQTSDLVLDAFKDGVARFGKPQEVLTDQGRQYFAWRGKSELEKLLEKEGIKHVVSRSHHPQTLGKCERFWATVKSELWERTKPADLDEAIARLKHFIDHYNHHRPHQGLDGQCPADRFFGVASDVREAVEKSIAENAHRLSVGELPKPPAFLIGQIGDQKIAFHGTSGNFYLTQEGPKDESNDGFKSRTSDRANGSTSEARPPAQEAAGHVGERPEAPVPGNPGAGSMGSGVGRGSWTGAGESCDHVGILAGPTEPSGSGASARSEPAEALAAEQSSSCGHGCGITDPAAIAKELGVESERRRESEEAQGADRRIGEDR
jgi:transposase InsO family protein